MRTPFLLCLLSLWPYLCLAEPEGPKNLPEMIDHTRALRTLMQSDPHRPKEIGIFSGGAFVSREGVPHVIYYSLGDVIDTKKSMHYPQEDMCGKEQVSVKE